MRFLPRRDIIEDPVMSRLFFCFACDIRQDVILEEDAAGGGIRSNF